MRNNVAVNNGDPSGGRELVVDLEGEFRRCRRVADFQWGFTSEGGLELPPITFCAVLRGAPLSPKAQVNRCHAHLLMMGRCGASTVVCDHTCDRRPPSAPINACPFSRHPRPGEE